VLLQPLFYKNVTFLSFKIVNKERKQAKLFCYAYISIFLQFLFTNATKRLKLYPHWSMHNTLKREKYQQLSG